MNIKVKQANKTPKPKANIVHKDERLNAFFFPLNWGHGSTVIQHSMEALPRAKYREVEIKDRQEIKK